MRKVMVLVLTLSILGFAALATEISVVKQGAQLKVAEVIVETNCKEIYDMDPDVDVEYNCHVGTIKSKIKKEFSNVTKIEGVNSSSDAVIRNQVDNEGAYTAKIRVYYY